MWVRPCSREVLRSAMSRRLRFGGGDCLRAHGPYGRDPGKAGAGVPLFGEVVPAEGAGVGFDLGAVLECEQGGVADDESGVGMGEHCGHVGGGFGEFGMRTEEVVEENLSVGDGAARGDVGGDGLYVGERERLLDDELDRAYAAEAGDGAAGDDAELGREGGDGDEAEVGAAGEELGGALRGGGEVQVVAVSAAAIAGGRGGSPT